MLNGHQAWYCADKRLESGYERDEKLLCDESAKRLKDVAGVVMQKLWPCLSLSIAFCMQRSYWVVFF